MLKKSKFERDEICTVQQPAGLLYTPQTGQDETRDDIIRNQLTLIDT